MELVNIFIGELYVNTVHDNVELTPPRTSYTSIVTVWLNQHMVLLKRFANKLSNSCNVFREAVLVLLEGCAMFHL